MISNDTWWSQFLWIVAAGILGFGVAAVFAGWLELRRTWFLVPYSIVTVAFLYAYLRWSQIDLMAVFRQHWVWGLVGGVLAGAFVIKNVLSQPAYPRPAGGELVFDLLWFGGVYGILDALLLSVLPILATWQAFSTLGWTEGWVGLVGAGVVAFAASLFVTAVYHLGYPEFRGTEVIQPVIGNGSMSLAYIITRNPLAAVISHVGMHVAAVMHGLETAVQLPPHY